MEHLELGNKKFPLTFAGLNMLAKYIVDYYVEPLGKAVDYFNQQNINLGFSTKIRTDIFRYFVIRSLIDKYSTLFHAYDSYDLVRKVKNYLYDKLSDFVKLHIDDFVTWRFGYLDCVAFSNIVNTYGSGFRFFKDTFKIGSNYYPNKFKKYLRTCEVCGEKFFSQEELLEDFCNVNEVVPQHLIGYDGYCNDCAKEHYTQCDFCGCFSDDVETCENNGERACYDCRQNGDFAYCEECGGLIDLNDSYEYSSQYGYYFCSCSCAENYGLHYSEDEEDWTDHCDDYSDFIGSYHSHSYDSVCAQNDKYPHLKCGVEIEIDGQNRSDYDYDYWSKLDTMLGRHAFMEDDGSVEVEIVSQPHTEKAFRSFDWAKILNKLSKDGWKSHDCGTCGQHFHFSQEYLGYTENQIKDSAKKVAAFFQYYWSDIVKFSRRREEDLHWCNDYGFEISKDTNFRDMRHDRYKAVNVMNLFNGRKSTIEIRIARGTLNPTTFMANYDFLLHIVRHAKKISWKNVHKAELWLKGIAPETIEYLKSRDCSFNGAI